jgi:hypothetical protein
MAGALSQGSMQSFFCGAELIERALGAERV